jgi:hypothetical protein
VCWAVSCCFLRHCCLFGSFWAFWPLMLVLIRAAATTTQMAHAISSPIIPTKHRSTSFFSAFRCCSLQPEHGSLGAVALMQPDYVSRPTAGEISHSIQPLPAGSGLTLCVSRSSGHVAQQAYASREVVSDKCLGSRGQAVCARLLFMWPQGFRSHRNHRTVTSWLGQGRASNHPGADKY